jgi:UDP-N-acetylmuramate dehydrogenase
MALSKLALSQQFDLKAYNSLALPACAEYFCIATEPEHIYQAVQYARDNQLAVTPLGGGSNMVLAGDIAGLVILIKTRGIQAKKSNNDLLQVTFAAGENWHNAVEYCLEQGWYGLENLSLIPGNMGAAPIQNIGAYGVELSDLFVSLEAIELCSGKSVTLDRAACQFGYRDSIFKGISRDQYLITQVTLALSAQPTVELGYPALREALDEPNPTPQAVSEAVCQIRQAKLPDPAKIANAGSFFKNPVIAVEQANTLLLSFPQMPCFPQGGRKTKIPAAWLIDQCGFRGVRQGGVGVHEHQALVLVNISGTGSELLALADEIAAAVLARFGIALDIEPRVYGRG